MYRDQGTLWPIHPKPFDSEILSSWLSRTAAGHGLSLQQFRKLCLPRIPGHGPDIDQIDNPHFFDVLAKGVGVSVEEAFRTGFASDQGRVYDRVVINSLEWIAPLSPLQGGVRRLAIPFCPSCLAVDKVPYYRKRWRYAFHPVCPEHGLLAYECPRCRHPYAYLGHDGIAGTSTGSGAIGVCRKCGQHFPPTRIPGLEDGVLGSVADIQKDLLSALDNGWIEIAEEGALHVCLYLRGLHNLAAIFQHPGWGADAATWVGREMGMPTSAWNRMGWEGSLESRPVVIRAWLLLFASWLACGWPDHLVALIKGAGIKPSQALSRAKDRPFWMIHPIVEDLFPVAFGRSEQEIASARKVLAARREWPPSEAELRRFMLTGVVPDIKPLSNPVDTKARQILQAGEEQAAAFREERKREAATRQAQPPALYPPLPLNSASQVVQEAVEEISRDVPALDRWTRRKRSTSN